MSQEAPSEVRDTPPRTQPSSRAESRRAQQRRSTGDLRARLRRAWPLVALVGVIMTVGLTALLRPDSAPFQALTTQLGDPAPSTGAVGSATAGTAASGGASGSATPSAAVGSATATRSGAKAVGSPSAGATRTAARGGAPAIVLAGARPAAEGPLKVGLAFTDVLPWMSASARNDLLDKAAATHATWIRMDLPWRGVQPTSNGPMTWELYDASVKAARDRGQHVLMILGQAPEWARDSSCSSDLACPPASDAAFATFAAANARHYAGMGVHHYEIWNEPNVPGFWHGGDATRYGNLVKAAADAIHGADPQGQAILGGLAAAAGGLDIRDQVQFLTQICNTGACAKLDGVGYHPYTYPLPASARPSWPTPWTRMSLDQNSLRSVLSSAGRSDLQFWVTEFGAPTDGPGRVSQGGPESLENPTDHVTEAVQADLAGDVLLTAAADSRIAAVFWHMLQDNPKAGGAIESSYGLLRSDGSPKPAYGAYANGAAAVN